MNEIRAVCSLIFKVSFLMDSDMDSFLSFGAHDFKHCGTSAGLEIPSFFLYEFLFFWKDH